MFEFDLVFLLDFTDFRLDFLGVLAGAFGGLFQFDLVFLLDFADFRLDFLGVFAGAVDDLCEFKLGLFMLFPGIGKLVRALIQCLLQLFGLLFKFGFGFLHGGLVLLALLNLFLEFLGLLRDHGFEIVLAGAEGNL